MRVVCPACAAVYEVPAPVVEARRTVRCATCGSQFLAGETKRPVPPPDMAAQSARVSSPAPDASELRVGQAARLPVSGEIASPAARPRASAVVLAGWLVSVVLLGAGVAAALAWRQPIMRAWPPAARAYAALGYGH